MAWDISGKKVLITGATDGIGKATAKALVRKGAEIIILTRDLHKGEMVAQELSPRHTHQHVHVVACDLASFASIQKAAHEYIQRFHTLDVLINVAGVMPVYEQKSQNGIELNMAVNYFAPVLLTELLLPLLQRSGSARIINVTSSLYKRGVIDLHALEGMHVYNRYQAYGNSKMALMLYTFFLAERLKENHIAVNAVHPGWIRTKLALGALKKTGFFARQVFTLFKMRPAWYGARTIVYLATNPAIESVTGEYFIKNRPTETKPAARDLTLAHELHSRTLAILTPYL